MKLENDYTLSPLFSPLEVRVSIPSFTHTQLMFSFKNISRKSLVEQYEPRILFEIIFFKKKTEFSVSFCLTFVMLPLGTVYFCFTYQHEIDTILNIFIKCMGHALLFLL